ncbi:MAG: serine hydrolase [Verrucomicrobia bacterium]|nr:serine hydrolase [Verrucomicrobiota bacterium]
MNSPRANPSFGDEPVCGAQRFSRFQRAALALLLILSAGITAQAIPWVERHGISGATLQSEFDTWTAAPYSLRLTRLSGSESGGQARYVAIFEKSAKTTGWVAHNGMTASDFTSTHNTLHGQGFRLVWLDGFGVGGIAFYNGIWEQTSGPAQRVRLGESLAAHQSASTANQAAGFGLVDVSAFSVSGTPLHAGIWAQGSTLDPQVRYSRTSAQYQSDFNSMGASGHYLWRVSGFDSNGSELFTAVWRKTSLGEGWCYHGMSAGDFEANNINAEHQGYRPVFVEPYNVGADARYNACWVRNGGLSSARLGTLSTAVQNYMSARSLPGLSLAIAREGRLVYARGFGYANTANGEVAHAQHRWRIASSSKTICAVSALRALEDSAAWSLDSKAFGAGALFGTDYGTKAYSAAEKSISLRELMTMTSGWTDQGKLWYNDEPAFGTDHAKIIGYQLDNVGMSSTPGTMDCYNNFNYQVVARIPEKISGLSFEAYAKAQVFDPCGMTSLSLGGRTAADRQFNEVSYYAGNQWGTPEAIWPARMDGSTGWITKPSDLLLLARRIDGNPRHRDIIGSYALSQMQKGNGQPSCNGGTSSYGLGWYPSSRNGKTWWQHNGAMAGTQAILVVSDDGSQAFAYACNSVHSSDWPSGLFEATVLDLMKGIDDAKEWPSIDLFGKYNPEYDAWAASTFGGAVVSRTGLSDFWAPSADPDDDGRSNAFEAYVGSDPLHADGSPWVSIYHGGGDLVLRWLKRNGYRGVEAGSDWSVGLVPWTGAPATIVDRTDLFSLPGYTIQEAKVAIPRGTQHRYLRLNLDVP